MQVKKGKTISGSKDAIVVSFTATGMGIDVEITPRLFNKFITNSFQGTGLEVFLSQKVFLQLMTGTWAENKKDCIGATLSFSLPLKA